jgi:hypothetical protein
MSIEFNSANGISATGNIFATNFLIGDGEYLSNVAATNLNLQNIQSNFIPATNVVYSLGNATNQWKDLWVSNSTVYINSVPISVNSGNILTVSGDPVLLASNSAPYSMANIATTANIVAGNVVMLAGGNLVFADSTRQSTGYSNVILATYLPLANAALANVGNIALDSNLTVGGNITTPGNTTIGGNLYANNVISNNTVTGTLTTSYQPNITSVGNLTSVNVSGPASFGNINVTGNAIVGNLQATGNVQIPAGNVTIAYGNASELFGDAYGYGALYAGINANVTLDSNTVAQFTAGYTDYAAVTFQNINPGANASTDWVITADNGSDTTYFVDMGMASSTFTGNAANALGNVVTANDGYLYVAGGGAGQPGGNLNLAATTSNRTVQFFAGSGNAANILMTVAGANVNVPGNITATYYTGDGSNLTGVNYGNIVYNGTSNISIPVADGNINVNINGSAAGLFAPNNLALGVGAGANAGSFSVALGFGAGANAQGAYAVAIGTQAAYQSQGANAVAIGWQAGGNAQGYGGVALGKTAAQSGQGANTVAIGFQAGLGTQGNGAIAIGYAAGITNQGSNSIAIGGLTALTNMPAGAIAINATGLSTAPSAAGFYAVPLRTQGSNTTLYQQTAYSPATGMISGWYPGNYNGFSYINPASANPLPANITGGALQLAAVKTLPLANSVPAGTKFNFYVNGASEAVYPNASNFIYLGFASLGSGGQIFLYNGESLELVSRGPGSNEWDISGGTGVLKYLAQNQTNTNAGGIWRVGVAPTTAWQTAAQLYTWQPSSISIAAYMGNDGYLYVASPSTTITIQGQIMQLCYGNGANFNAITGQTLNSSYSKIPCDHAQGTTGDTFEFTFSDLTNNRMYRITAIKTNSSPNQGSVVIERLN